MGWVIGGHIVKVGGGGRCYDRRSEIDDGRGHRFECVTVIREQSVCSDRSSGDVIGGGWDERETPGIYMGHTVL